jgi:hypothetical protein
MGVSKSMKIFMEGMQNSMVNRGYGSKILNTPMGPFKWDDNTEMWVNVNNGFRMPNISMIDMIEMGGEPLIDQNAISNISKICKDTLPNYGSKTVSILPVAVTLIPSVSNSPTLTCNPQIYISDEIGIATHQIVFAYSTDSGSSYTDTGTYPAGSGSGLITFPKTASFGGDFKIKAYKKNVVNWTTPGTYTFYVKNAYDNSTIYTVVLTTTNPA